MNFSENSCEGIGIVGLKGRIDSGTAKHCEDFLLPRAADGRPALVLDLHEVDYVSSAGLRVLVMASKRAQGLGRGFAICRLQEGVAEVLEISGLNDILGVHADIASAVQAVKG